MRTLWKKRIAPYIDNDIRRWVLIGILTVFLVVGLILGWGSIIQGLLDINTHPSQLISDYVAIAGPGPALVNAALVGFAGLGLVSVLKVNITGPSMAAIMTMTGFGLFGKNILNILPIFAGVWIYSLFEGGGMRKFLMPALFGSAMGPIFSQVAFGTGLGWGLAVVAGVVAGFVISPLAAHLLRNHQGLNLYNLGFTGGFIGIFFAALLRGLDNEVPAYMIWDQDHTPLFAGLLISLCLALIVTRPDLEQGKALWIQGYSRSFR